MNTICTVAFSFLIFSSIGQISLSSADFGASGDTIRVTNASNLTADFVTTGANKIWNFTQFTPASQTVKRFGPMSEVSGFPLFIYGPSAPVNYRASYYTDANIPIDQLSGILPISIDDIYQYSRKTADSITMIGISMTVNGTAIPAKSDTIETKYNFPLVFGNVHSSRGYTRLNMNPFFDAEWIQHRTRTTTIDGWGQLTTVYGTYDVLRVKHEITENDSLYYNGTWIALPIPNSTEYEWIANGEKTPLLKMTTSSLAGFEQITAIEYRDNQVLGINKISDIHAEVYPNPTSEYLYVNLNEKAEKIQLVDIAGRVVLTDLNPQLINNYSLTDFQSGIYQLIITNQSSSKVLTVVKK